MSQSVADWCRTKGISVAELAARSGFDLGRVEAIALGRWTPSPKERERVSTALGVAIDEIAWGHVTPIQHLYGHGPG